MRLQNSEKTTDGTPLAQMQMGTALPGARRIRYLVLGLLIFPSLACNELGGSGPLAAAKSFTSIMVERDFEKLFPDESKHLSEEEKEKQGNMNKLAMVVLGQQLNQKHGGLQGASVLREVEANDRTAKVLVVWHFAEGDQAEVLKLVKKGGKWTVFDFKIKGIRGEMKGKTFFADSPFPSTPGITLAEAKPFDRNNTLFMDGRLMQITDLRLINVWDKKQYLSFIRGWGENDLLLHFADGKGLGSIDSRAFKTWSWNMPDKMHGAPLRYRPDYHEVAFVKNKDLFTIATNKGSSPVRWTQGGNLDSIVGWANHNMLVVKNSRATHVITRDGASYKTSKSVGGWSIYDHDGYLSLLDIQDKLYKPGLKALELMVEIPAQYAWRQIGWTTDNRFFVFWPIRTNAKYKGVSAIDRQGKVKKITPGLDFMGTGQIKSGSRAPKGSQFVVAWAGVNNTGIYLGDAGTGKWQRLGNMLADSVFWVEPKALIYSVNRGPKMGTWGLPIDSPKAEKICDFPAHLVTATPDGRLFLKGSDQGANPVLWLYDGKVRFLEKEGGLRARQTWFWPQKMPAF